MNSSINLQDYDLISKSSMWMRESINKCIRVVTRKKNYKPRNLLYAFLILVSFPVAYYFTSSYEKVVDI